MVAKAKKTPNNNLITFPNVSALQIILAGFTKRSKKIINEDSDSNTLPQTIIDDNVEIPVSELLHEKDKRVYFFLDTRKIKNKLWSNMFDVTNSGPLPAVTNKPCWWCRHSFQTKPIGCPLKYYSYDADDINSIRFREKLEKEGFPTETTDLFETEGYFCSFPCCKAYIISQRGNIKYKESSSLLSLLFITFYGSQKSLPTITAPSWKLLKEYGGHLSIQEFRSSFGQLEYQETVNVRRPYMFSSSQYISEHKLKPFKSIKE
jgi:hypothetical protein